MNTKMTKIQMILTKILFPIKKMNKYKMKNKLLIIIIYQKNKTKIVNFKKKY